MSSSSSQNSPEPDGLLQILAVAFSGVLFGWFLSKLRAPNHESGTSGNPQDTTTDERRALQSNPLRVFVERIPPPTPQQESREDRKERRDRKNIWIQGAIAFFACVYATVAFFQWRAQIHGLKIDQRAWVGVMTADPPDLRPKSDFSVRVHVINSGHTPALNFSSEIVLHSLRKEETFEPVYGAGIENPSRGVIQPNEIIFLQSIQTPLTQLQIDWIKNGNFILYVYGRMSYDDIFNVTHHTTFCKEVLSESLVRDCGTYNMAD
ncbi:MAG: hypothetical protein ABSH13_08780 [Candidatus Acidiferrum sp.]|jgi:hypothetical protein